MIIRTLIPHNLHPELAEYVEKIKTHGEKAIIGEFVWLDATDLDEQREDIRRIAQWIEKIENLQSRVKYPWMVREILDGHAVLLDGILVYKDRKHSPLRKRIEAVVGALTDQQYNEVLEIAAQDIEFNKVQFKKETTLDEVIKIAAQSAIALKRCGA